MKNKENDIESLLSESYKNKLDTWYRAYNISREKLELFHDFLISLNDLINSTYLGDDVLETNKQHKEHFLWCWKKTIDNFKKERIEFKENGLHLDYFLNFYIESFYTNNSNEDTLILLNYYNQLFDFNHTKTSNELDILTYIYKLFDQNLKK